MTHSLVSVWPCVTLMEMVFRHRRRPWAYEDREPQPPTYNQGAVIVHLG